MKNDLLQAIFQLTSAISAANSLESSFSKLIERVQRGLSADRIAILLFDEIGVMRFKATSGLSPEYCKKVEGHSPWPRNVHEPKPILVSDVAEDSSLEEFKEIILNEGIRAMAFVPLYQHDRLLGKFMVYFNTPHHFSDDEILFARTAASLVSFALDREKVEQELRKREQEMTAMVEDAPVGVHCIGPDGVILWADKRDMDILGYSREEYIGHHISEFHIFADICLQLLERASKGAPIDSIEAALRCKDDTVRHVQISTAPLWKNGEFVYTRCYTRDITEQKRRQDEITQSLKAKDILISEIHHRVKNNFQIVSNLLSMKTAGADEQSAHLLRESQNRIRIMALIHEKLYKLGAASELNLGEHIKEIAATLHSSYGQNDKVRLSLLCEEVLVETDMAISIGLIVNEIISNAFKYAFPDSHGGEITIKLSPKQEYCELGIHDNGIGFNGSSSRNGMGFRLIEMLVKQIGGSIRLDGTKGTSYQITFPCIQAARRVKGVS